MTLSLLSFTSKGSFSLDSPKTQADSLLLLGSLRVLDNRVLCSLTLRTLRSILRKRYPGLFGVLVLRRTKHHLCALMCLSLSRTCLRSVYSLPDSFHVINLPVIASRALLDVLQVLLFVKQFVKGPNSGKRAGQTLKGITCKVQKDHLFIKPWSSFCDCNPVVLQNMVPYYL